MKLLPQLLRIARSQWIESCVLAQKLVHSHPAGKSGFRQIPDSFPHLDRVHNGSRPKTRTVRSPPATAQQCLINVVLPAPFSPTNPRRTARNKEGTSFNAVLAPNRAKAGNGDDGSAEDGEEASSHSLLLHQSVPLRSSF